MRRWLVTGASGQLGSDVVRVLRNQDGQDLLSLTSRELDITDAVAVDSVLTDYVPDVVINTAAYTAVDAAENDEDRALLVNGQGPSNLARLCARLGSRMVQVSTDYVFSGTADQPYAENAEPDPHSAYGRTKLAGERAVAAAVDAYYIVRTAWLYGTTGSNFVKTMLRLEQARDTIHVVDDQRGSPTWSLDLATGLVALVDREVPFGIYHYTNWGSATWYDLARAVFEGVGADPDRVRPTTTKDFPRPAPRPAYSVLGHSRWNAVDLPPPREWRSALEAALPAIHRLSTAPS